MHSLQVRGYEVIGLGLPRYHNETLIRSLGYRLFEGDLNDPKFVAHVMDVVGAIDHGIHFAAEPLVSQGWARPLEHYRNNVGCMLSGLNLFAQLGARSALIATTDKVYAPPHEKAHLESDPLLGSCPYSVSKVACENVIRDFVSLPRPDERLINIAIARVGNVYGLGDFSPFRLFSDIQRAILDGAAITVRNKYAVRPWSNITDVTEFYVKLFEHNIGRSGSDLLTCNFSSDGGSSITVDQILNLARQFFPGLDFRALSQKEFFPEVDYLRLNNQKSKNLFGEFERYSGLPGFEKEFTLLAKYSKGSKLAGLIEL